MTLAVEPPLRDVVIRAWGATSQDAADAADSARRAPAACRWTVLKVALSTQPPCDIPGRDPSAIAQGADYDSAWAAYPAALADGPRTSAPATTPSANPTTRGGR